jgi:hypothetical protein
MSAAGSWGSRCNATTATYNESVTDVLRTYATCVALKEAVALTKLRQAFSKPRLSEEAKGREGERALGFKV